MKENPEEEIIKATQKNFHFLLGIAQQKKKHTHTEKTIQNTFFFISLKLGIMQKQAPNLIIGTMNAYI